MAASAIIWARGMGVVMAPNVGAGSGYVAFVLVGGGDAYVAGRLVGRGESSGEGKEGRDYGDGECLHDEILRAGYRRSDE